MNPRNIWRQHTRHFRHTFKAGSLLWFMIALISGAYAYYDVITKNNNTNTDSVSGSGIIAALASALIAIGDRYLSYRESKKQGKKEHDRIPDAVREASECMMDVSNLSKKDINEFFRNVLKFGCKHYFPEDVRVRAAYYALEARESERTETSGNDYYLNKLAEYCREIGFSDVVEPRGDENNATDRMIKCALGDDPVIVADVTKDETPNWIGREVSDPSNKKYQSFISFPIHFRDEERQKKTNVGMAGLLCIDAPEPYDLTHQDRAWVMALSTMIKNGIMFWNHTGNVSHPRPTRPAQLSATLRQQKGH